MKAFEENLGGKLDKLSNRMCSGELRAAAGPVGCGDSTTVVIDADTVLQTDLHHVDESENNDDPRSPTMDETRGGHVS